MLEKGTTIPIQYCLTDELKYPTLQQIAVRMFSLVASSAAKERNFSTVAFVHSKLRNKLSQENVMKLVYIKTNYSCFTDFNVQDDEDDDEEQEFNFQQLLFYILKYFAF